MRPSRQRTPVVVITGFLGAGKTSLINNVLTGPHGRRFAVIVNEFGDLGIDGALIDPSSAQVIEVPNGCMCCSSRGDLVRALAAVLQTGENFDGILIETSGLAQPLGIVDALVSPQFGDAVCLDGVLTVVDAANYDANLENAVVAYQQLAAADVLIINKVDLVDRAVVSTIERRLAGLNPLAAIVSTTGCEIPIEALTRGSVGAAASARPPSERSSSESSSCDHDPAFETFEWVIEGAVDHVHFLEWTSTFPRSAIRVKAVIRFKRTEGWFSYNRVGAREDLTRIGRTALDSDSFGKLVAIGRHLNHEELREGAHTFMTKEMSINV